MEATAATTPQQPAPVIAAVRPDEFRAALERTLELAAADQRIGPLICATGLRLRFVFGDCGVALNIAAADDRESFSWWFGERPGWSPGLELEMDSAVANRYLQGRESLAIAIAHGQVRVRGESRTALLYLPATRLLCEPYRRVIESEHPALVAG